MTLEEKEKRKLKRERYEGELGALMRTRLVVLISFLFITSFTLSLWSTPATSSVLRDIPDWPTEQLRILFIHHSCGERLWQTHSDLSGELNAINIEPHDATYGDTIGDDTDVCHWYPKFRDQLSLLLTFDHSTDTYYPFGSGIVNDIVMFKSCYPASDIWGMGSGPGDPESCDQSVVNYQATYNALLAIFRANPETLFIPMTAPPLNRDGGWTSENGGNASYFNHWLADDWAPTDTNIAVFDWFHFLANETDFAAKDHYVDGSDSHPNTLACEETTTVFIDWVDDIIIRWQEGASTTTPPGTGGTTTPPPIPGFPWMAIIPALAIALTLGLKRRKAL